VKQISWLTVTTASLTLSLAGASLGGFAQYDRSAILRGELWRLVTGHFSHWSTSHLAYDLSAFIILGAICKRRDRRLFATVVASTATVVSLFLLAFRPDVELYRGLSAIDSALWMLAVFVVSERRPRLAAALAMMFLAKVVIESRSGALFVQGITVLPVVHLIGAAVGFIMFGCRSRTFSPRQRFANCAYKSRTSPAASSSIASLAPPALI
jgi:rhomboid family GlyGly-CTERM serine protease